MVRCPDGSTVLPCACNVEHSIKIGHHHHNANSNSQRKGEEGWIEGREGVQDLTKCRLIEEQSTHLVYPES